jgi:hypothetical protein
MNLSANYAQAGLPNISFSCRTMFLEDKKKRRTRNGATTQQYASNSFGKNILQTSSLL